MNEVKWCCKNPQCKRLNLVESSRVEDVMKKSQKVLLICGTCGYVHNQGNLKGPEKANYLECIPYTAAESRLPTGRLPNGSYSDYMGRQCNREDFIIEYGIDPKIWCDWRDAGMPRYKTVCE
jgi:hypothetical protein